MARIDFEPVFDGSATNLRSLVAKRQDWRSVMLQ